MSRILPAALLAFALVPGFAQGTDNPQAPRGLAAVDAGDSALVSWAPDVQNADARHNVYGLRDGALVLLGTAVAGSTTFTAEGGFESYGVSTLLEDEESELAFPCILIRLHKMPPINIHLACIPKPPREAQVLLPPLP